MTTSMNHARDAKVFTGGCLCGAVKYEVRGPLRPVTACHCEQCRRTDFVLVEDRGLEWYQSSAWARRGFCKQCGSSLFWAPVDDRQISLMAGTLDQPTGLETEMHIYADQCADYHRLPDGAIQITSGEYLRRFARNDPT